MPLLEPLLLLTAQFQTQLRGDFTRNLFLNSENIVRFAVVLLTPQLRTVCDINQLCFDNQILAQLQDFTRQDGAHIKRAADLLWINFSTLVTEDGAAGHYFHVGNL